MRLIASLEYLANFVINISKVSEETKLPPSLKFNDFILSTFAILF